MSFFYRILVVFLLIATKNQIESTEKTANRIVGGYKCEITDYPFIISIIGKNLCGGSLITLQWVLTAGHCVEPEDLASAPVKIRAGFTSRPELIQERNLKHAVSHPLYNGQLLMQAKEIRYDIGLILIDQPFIRSPVSIPITLAPPGYAARCRHGMAAGIGKIVGNESIGAAVRARPLRCVILPIVDAWTCHKTFPNAYIDNSVICTQDYGKDTCVGDSGGPLVCGKYLIAVISFGPTDCGKVGAASYTNVEYYLDFIDQVIHPMTRKKSLGPPKSKNTPGSSTQIIDSRKLSILMVLLCLIMY